MITVPISISFYRFSANKTWPYGAITPMCIWSRIFYHGTLYQFSKIVLQLKTPPLGQGLVKPECTQTLQTQAPQMTRLVILVIVLRLVNVCMSETIPQ